MKWVIGKLPKEKTPILEGTVNLSDPKGASDSNPVIDVEFKISMHSISGLKIENLIVYTEKYKPFKGVKSLSKAGKLHFRS